MKSFFFLAIIFCQSIFAWDLTYTHSSKHFEISCVEADKLGVQEFSSFLEKNYAELSKIFHHEYHGILHVKMYPDLYEMDKELSSHLCYTMKREGHNTFLVYRPAGLALEKIKGSFLSNVVEAFIYDRLQKTPVPYWLVMGFVWNFTNKATSVPFEDITLNRLTVKPTVKDLDVYDLPSFSDQHASEWAFSLVYFIERRVGLEKLGQLITNFKSFEEIVGLSKEELFKKWQASLKE